MSSNLTFPTISLKAGKKFFDLRNYGVPSTPNNRKVVTDKPRKGDKVVPIFQIDRAAMKGLRTLYANERDGLTKFA